MVQREISKGGWQTALLFGSVQPGGQRIIASGVSHRSNENHSVS